MLYLIKGYGKNGPVLKIGFSDNWNKREEAYITHTPDYEVLGTRDGDKSLELYFKRKLEKYKYRSLSEWMYYDEEIISLFKTLNPTEEDVLSIVNCNIQTARRRLEGKRKISDIVITVQDDFSTEVTDFAKEFNLASSFRDKMKISGKFIKKYGAENYLSYIPEVFRFYIISLGVDFIIANKGEKKLLDDAINKMNTDKIFPKETLDEIILNYFQVGERYSKKQIKIDLEKIYKSVGIANKPKATDLERWYELKPTKLSNKQTGKRDMGFEILAQK